MNDCSDEVVVSVKNVGKCFEIYDKPIDRLRQIVQKPFTGKNYFTEFWALKNITFEIKKGKTVGIVGKNGSGKSTLLQLICGTLTPTKGSVKIAGRVAALLELGSGFNPEFTGRENIIINAMILGLTEGQVAQRIDAIINFADIGEFIERPVKLYSSGMYVRLAFAVVAHVDADILIIDEALSVGDVFFVQKCMRFIRKFKENGTIIFVSHDTGSILGLTEEAIMLEGGGIVEMGDSKKVIEKYMEKMYMEKIESSMLGDDGKKIVLLADAKNDEAKANEQISGPNDIRQQWFEETGNHTTIKIFHFNSEAESFGVGGARVIGVKIRDKDNNVKSYVQGGEVVAIEIDCKANVEINLPIIGFEVKDRLGQRIFVENTYAAMLGKNMGFKGGSIYRVRFMFQMPRMPVGDYSISAAIAEGSEIDHIQHHWIHDAMAFKVISSSIVWGLVGINILGVEYNELK